MQEVFYWGDIFWRFGFGVFGKVPMNLINWNYFAWISYLGFFEIKKFIAKCGTCNIESLITWGKGSGFYKTSYSSSNLETIIQSWILVSSNHGMKIFIWVRFIWSLRFRVLANFIRLEQILAKMGVDVHLESCILWLQGF